MIYRAQLYDMHEELCRAAKGIMERKNRDYGESTDPFRNFRAHGLFGMIVRMHDKLARMQTFVERGNLVVVEESITDCVLDLINYAILFEGYRIDDASDTRRDKKGQGDPRPVPEGPHKGTGVTGGGIRGSSEGDGRIDPSAPAEQFLQAVEKMLDAGATAYDMQQLAVARENRRRGGDGR